MEEMYNRHYIKLDDQNRITDGWSDGPHPRRDTAGRICIDEKGGYQFRITPNGEENPELIEGHGIPLYSWDGYRVVKRTAEEVAEDIAALPVPAPQPSLEEKNRADIDFIAIMTGVEL